MYKGSLSIQTVDDSKWIISLMNKDIEYKRSKIRIKEGNGSINIEIEAEDPVALVSSMGNVLKQIKIISEVKELADGKKAVGKNGKQNGKKRI